MRRGSYVTEEPCGTESRQNTNITAVPAWLTKFGRLILTYLIPCHLLNTHTLPTTLLLAPYPRLQTLFADLSTSIRRGDLAGFDSALAAGEDEFVKRRIYLTLERGRDIALRNLFRKVFLAGGMEEAKDSTQPVRRTRIPVDDFAVAIRLASRSQDEPLENDEVECLLANMIYKVSSLCFSDLSECLGRLLLGHAPL